MAEFSDVGGRCSFEDCNRSEFLPFHCSACGFDFCKDHSSFREHNCPNAETYLKEHPSFEEGEGLKDRAASSKVEPPSTNGLSAAQVLHNVRHRFDNADSLNKSKDHIKVKGSKAEEAAKSGGEFSKDRYFDNAQKIIQSSSKEKEKSISLQVRKMKIKSNSVGPSGVEMDNRFFLHVKLNLPETEWNRYMYFPRLWTLGHAVDYIKNFLPYSEQQAFSGSILDVFCERTHTTAPLDQVLLNSSLQSFDVVFLGIQGSFSELIDSQKEGNKFQQEEIEALILDPEQESTTYLEDDKSLNKEAGMPAVEVPQQVFEAKITNPNSISITVKYGKDSFTISGIEPEAQTILDLKKRIEGLAHVPFRKQKLIYKGILHDSKLISETAVKEGSKVMMMLLQK